MPPPFHRPGMAGSEGRHRNVMDPAFTGIGAGYPVGPFGGYPAARFRIVR
jgi:hypothetical protein